MLVSSSAGPCMIGIAGCSGSGQTTLARALSSRLDATLFPLDLYYRDLSQFPLDTRHKRNFDHPAALESELFLKHLGTLAQNHPIQRPVYDFRTHTRVPDTFELVTPRAFVIIEGIFALYFAELNKLYHLAVYVDAPEAVCLARRVERDVRERGRTEESVREQYEAAVRPMAEQYILPSQAHATLTVDGAQPTERAVAAVLHALPAGACEGPTACNPT